MDERRLMDNESDQSRSHRPVRIRRPQPQRLVPRGGVGRGFVSEATQRWLRCDRNQLLCGRILYEFSRLMGPIGLPRDLLVEVTIRGCHH
jgi:hypothetical protein